MKTSQAERLINFFDQDWKTAKSTIRSSHKLANSRRHIFSRLPPSELPIQHSRPVALVDNARIIIMEKHPDGLAGLNLGNRPKSCVAKIPLTADQKDAGMIDDLSGTVPLLETAKSENKVIVLDEQIKFANMTLQGPQFRPATEPRCFRSAGSQLDQHLLTPAMRREVMIFEKQKSAADGFIRRAVSERKALREKIVGQSHHRGVLGFDNANNPDSEVTN